ncbi:MAG: hypothetical protein WC663_05935 [Patescibacteria group bacterium]|jgi:NTP pyrophosphatase (non-canonical NTP hydrolase)
MEKEERSLQDLMIHFWGLYERRNRIFLPSLSARINFLNVGIGNLQDAIRKNGDVEKELASVVARIFCVANHFWKLPLVEYMARKYPRGVCSYCLQKSCKCSERRLDPKLSYDPDAVIDFVVQMEWTLKEWCASMKEIYGKRNEQKGLENCLNRLFKEISELLQLLMRIPERSLTLDEMEKEFALELADTLAWTIAIANLLNIDLEAVVLKYYGNGCHNCHKDPCECTHSAF